MENRWPSGYNPNRNDNNLSNPYRIYPDSDESDDDEVLPLEAFRPALEEERWTVVGNPNRTKCYDTKLDCDQLKSTRDRLDHSGLRCGQLDHIDWIKSMIRTITCQMNRTRKTTIRSQQYCRPAGMRWHESIIRHPQVIKKVNHTRIRTN